MAVKIFLRCQHHCLKNLRLSLTTGYEPLIPMFLVDAGRLFLKLDSHLVQKPAEAEFLTTVKNLPLVVLKVHWNYFTASSLWDKKTVGAHMST